MAQFCVARGKRARRAIVFELLEVRALLCAAPPSWDVEPASVFEIEAAPPFATDQTFLLHSRPGAGKVIYLDFDGHVTSGTSWNSAYTGGADFTTPAYSFEGTTTSFTSNELERIQRVWQRVVEDFVPFDVDVTTQEPAAEDLRKSGTGDTRWGVRVVIGGNASWYGSAVGGVAYVSSFNWPSDTPCFVFEDNLSGGAEKTVAEAISHETGHTLGLSHDGRTSPVEEYYAGHGSGDTGWAPIMGVGYYQNLTQWSKGEYLNANRTQDDLSIISSNNGFGYRTDDYGDTNATATPLTTNTSGVIERTADVDVFSFTTSGSINLTINPFYIGPDLDILAELYNSSNGLVASSNPNSALNATLALSLAPGTYFLQISGVGNGAALSTGYTDYASLGQYTVTGTFDATPPTATLQSATPTTGAVTLSFNVTYADSSGVNVATLDSNDIAVSGPNGYSAAATFVSVDSSTNGTPRVATYRISAPGGFWNDVDNGTYTVTQVAGQVSDVAGASRPAGTIGTYSFSNLGFAWVSSGTLNVAFDTSGAAIQLGTAGANISVSKNGSSQNVAGISAISILGSNADDDLLVSAPLTPPLSFADSGGNDLLEIVGGTYAFASDIANASQNVAVHVASGATALFNASQHLRSLSVDGSATLGAGGNKTIFVSDLAVTGRLNLADNTLVWNSTTAGALTTATALVKAGRGGGNWLGNGIVTDRAAAIAPQFLATLGVSQSSQSVIVKYTYAGDANIDRVIGGDDFFAIDSGFAAKSNRYDGGDFNLTGMIDADDYFLIDSNYNKAQSPIV